MLSALCDVNHIYLFYSLPRRVTMYLICVTKTEQIFIKYITLCKMLFIPDNRQDCSEWWTRRVGISGIADGTIWCRDTQRVQAETSTNTKEDSKKIQWVCVYVFTSASDGRCFVDVTIKLCCTINKTGLCVWEVLQCWLFVEEDGFSLRPNLTQAPALIYTIFIFVSLCLAHINISFSFAIFLANFGPRKNKSTKQSLSVVNEIDSVCSRHSASYMYARLG